MLPKTPRGIVHGNTQSWIPPRGAIIPAFPTMEPLNASSFLPYPGISGSSRASQKLHPLLQDSHPRHRMLAGTNVKGRIHPRIPRSGGWGWLKGLCPERKMMGVEGVEPVHRGNPPWKRSRDLGEKTKPCPPALLVAVEQHGMVGAPYCMTGHLQGMRMNRLPHTALL